MKHLMNTTLLMAIIFLATACNNQSSPENNEKADDMNSAAIEQETTAPSANYAFTVKDDRLNAVYEHYTHLTKALANGNVADAKMASNAIEEGAKQVQGGTPIAKAAATITTATDIKAQRTAYSKLSTGMIALVKKAGVSNGELYVDYCPMAFGNEGASWISSSKEITNPYLGGKMLQCGDVKDTIK